MDNPFPDTPEKIMKALLRTPPRKREDLQFTKERERG